MSLLAQAQDLKVKAKSAAPQQATKVMTIDIDALEAFVLIFWIEEACYTLLAPSLNRKNFVRSFL